MAKKKTTPSPNPDPDRWSELASFVKRLYEEMDKLSKKAPSSLVSDLATERVNRAIAEAREFMTDLDPYMRDVQEFVPADTNPEIRDAVMILGEIMEALSRINKRFGLQRKLLEGW